MSEKGNAPAEEPGEKLTNETTPIEVKEEKDQKPDLPKAPISNYWRIVSYGSRTDHVLMLLALAASAGSGVAMPLMNIVLGNLFGDFNNYFLPNTDVTKGEFERAVDRFALIIFGLFIAKFGLTYISMVSDVQDVDCVAC
jgi:hypothetical protein